MNTIDELRKMAENVLSKHPRNIDLEKLGGNFKKLLDELSIYQIELEHQNKELELSEKSLAAAHDEFAKLFEITPVGYVILNENRRIVKANQTFINAFVPIRMRNNQFEGRCFDDFVTEEFKGTFQIFCKMAQSKDTPVPVELKLIDRLNMSRYVILTGRRYSTEAKTIAITASDISMQKAMEAQLTKAKEAETNASLQKSRFLANVNRELRTPLSTIIGYKEIMSDPQVTDAEKIKCCNEVIATSESLRQFTDCILDVSALESGEVPLKNKATDVNLLCERILPAYIRLFKKNNSVLNVRMPDIPKIKIDTLRLTQIINSALQHAIGNAKGVQVSFSCTYVSTNSYTGKLRLQFSGNGIFSSETEYQADEKQPFGIIESNDLNISVLKRTVGMMNGKIIWEHPLDSLIVELPVDISDEMLNSETHSTESGSQQNSNNGKCCLLIDDVEMNLRILDAMMRKLGYTTTLASSGGEAREYAKRYHFDVVLTDLWMPDINGEDIVIALRQIPEFENVPIYAVTADVENKNNFSMDFFTGTIIKPVSFENLKATINSSNG